ncbi:phage tail protein [Methanosarcina sp. T3]|uniref:phage tail protein n=1 Tax=Methanosarcina sp. T3 TaxID=3439062 RepID=UPI003F877C54
MGVDPYKNFRFLVEFDGIVQASFSEASGYGSDIEVVEFREGGDSAAMRKLPGKVSYPDITLKRGITDSHELYDWHLAAVSGQIQRKNGSIIILDDTGTEKIRWNFFNAWPSKWHGPDLNSTGKDVAIESLTISCERLERALS